MNDGSMARRQEEKRKYERKIAPQLLYHKDFVAERLRMEWNELKKSEKRDRILQGAAAGMKTVVGTILALAAVGGMVTVAAAAPNMVGAMAKMWGRRGFFDKRTFQKASHYVKQRGYAKIEPQNKGQYTITITDKGLRRVAERVLNNLRIPRQVRWDGWWRVVIFDIPNKHKHERDAFRAKLRSLGFKPMQESVFVLPYPCMEELRFLVSILSISGYVRFMETQHVMEDSDLRRHFSIQ